MKIEWDRAKAARNLLKHHIDFAEAATVLEDACALTIEDVFASEEARYVSIGIDGIGRILVVVYTFQEDAFRLISARRASPSERKAYEKRIRFQ